MYCDKGEELSSKMDFICVVDGFPLYLNKNQAHCGRVILVCDEHIPKISEMDPQKSADFFAAVHKVTRALDEVYHPDQINIGMYGDTVTHAHCHIVPKYNGGDEWGGTFQMNPGKVTLTDAEYEEMAEALRQALKEQ